MNSKNLLVWGQNLLIMLFTSVLCLGLLEFILSHWTDTGRYEQKIEGISSEEKCYSDCYTSNPRGYFPVVLKVPASRVFANAPDNQEIPLYCVGYSCHQRKQGFYPQRSESVYLVGDSVTFGEGNKDEDTLGHTLAEKFNTYNFKNYGETGASISRIHDIVKGLMEGSQGSTVKRMIYFYNLNDVLRSKEIDSQQKYIIDFENLRWNNRRSCAKNSLGEFFSRFALYRWADKIIVFNKESDLSVRNYLDMYFSPLNAAKLKETLDYIKDMNSLAVRRQVQFAVVIYPLLYKDLLGRYPFTPIHQFLMDFCTKNGIFCLDAYQAYDKYYSLSAMTVHPVDFHPNGMANRIVSDYLRKIPWLK